MYTISKKVLCKLHVVLAFQVLSIYGWGPELMLCALQYPQHDFVVAQMDYMQQAVEVSHVILLILAVIQTLHKAGSDACVGFRVGHQVHSNLPTVQERSQGRSCLWLPWAMRQLLEQAATTPSNSLAADGRVCRHKCTAGTRPCLALV